MRHQLVGYVLGSLDESEHKRVEEQLVEHPHLKKELEALRRSIEPLSADAAPFDPPDGLADRTCELIDIHRTSQTTAQVDKSKKTGADRPMFDTGPIPAPGRWSMADVAVAAGILVAATLLIFPAISHSRFNAHVAGCQNNLQQIGMALHGYSQQSGGPIPEIPQSGPLSVASIYAPKLLEAGFVSDPSLFFCSPAALADTPSDKQIPQWGKLVALAESGCDDLKDVLNQCGGSYAYDLGYMEDGSYHTRSLAEVCRSHHVIMADAPCPTRRGVQSSNHCGDGQNVLYEDGRVDYLTTNRSPARAGNDFYRNDEGHVAAGRHRNDAVVGSGTACPTE